MVSFTLGQDDGTVGGLTAEEALLTQIWSVYVCFWLYHMIFFSQSLPKGSNEEGEWKEVVLMKHPLLSWSCATECWPEQLTGSIYE